ncbi:MAG: hypothetical protein ACTSRA_08780 [Promethearchaeota archaeon]
MSFSFIIGRIIRLFATKTNSLFYVLLYREIQKEIVDLAEKLGVKPDKLAKEIGKRAARESAERHAGLLGLVPINPNNPHKIVRYIEILWNILFGQKLKDYQIEVEETEDYQKVRFIIKECPVCMGHEEDMEHYKEVFQAFTGKDSEGYACLMAGMLEELATIIMARKNMDIRLDIKESSCYARGDSQMVVEATTVPVEEYEKRKGIQVQITSERERLPPQAPGLESMAEESSRLFEKVAEALKLEKIDEIFEDPKMYIQDKIEEFVEKQLHFKPAEILAYFENYEDDLFRVMGYLSVHAVNEIGGVVGQIAGNYILSKILDIFIDGLEYGIETYIPPEIVKDTKRILLEFINNWTSDASTIAFQEIEPKQIFKLILDGMKIALRDLGAELVGAKKFNLIFDIFEESSLISGYLLAIPLRIMLTQSYETVKTPITSLQEVYQSTRVHLEKLFDLIEELQESDFAADREKHMPDISKAFPRVF